MTSHDEIPMIGLQAGDVLAGKYRVEEILGIGGMGVVIAAQHLQLEEKVALKFLLPQAMNDPDAVARFLREARAAVKIKNEHVARVSDVGTLPNGLPFMVMDYLDGRDLAAWVKERGPLPIDQAVEFVLQACVAVADAHALGIVHRDLKPANLFCVKRSDGQLMIKVLDFGISKLTNVNGSGASAAMTRTAATIGTPLYMSPEQMRSSRNVDRGTDIWSLGVILFELLVGKPVFWAESVTELAIKVASDPAPLLRTLRLDAPPALEAVILKCLEKDRARRYASVAELSVALLPFAPFRAKALVERISNILSTPALRGDTLMAPTGMPSGTTQASGTLPPVARTTTGGARGRAVVVAGLVAALLGIGAVVTLRTLLRRTVSNQESPAAATRLERAAAAPRATASTTANAALTVPSIEPLPSTPPVATIPPVSAMPAPSAPPAAAIPSISAMPPATPVPPAAAVPPVVAPSVVPSEESKGRRSLPAATPAGNSVAAQATSHSLPATKPAVNCNPPYYFDARGNRNFKPECL